MAKKKHFAEEKTVQKTSNSNKTEKYLRGLPETHLMCNITLDSLSLLRFSLRGATIYQRVQRGFLFFYPLLEFTP